MQDEFVGRHPGDKRNVKFAAGGDIEVHPLLVGQLSHRFTQERLGGIGNARAEGIDRFATPVAKVLFVVDECGRTELGCKIEDIAATDVEDSAEDLGRIRQQTGGKRPHVLHRLRSRNA